MRKKASNFATLSAETRADLVRRYAGGDGLNKLCKEFRISYEELRQYLVSRNITIRPRNRPPGATPEEAAAFATEYNRGMSIEAVAEDFHTQPWIVKAALIRMGHAIRSGYEERHQFRLIPSRKEDPISYDLAKKTEWRHANLDRCAEHQQRYCELHPERRQEARRRWVAANRGKVRIQNRNDRARRLDAPGKHSEQDIALLMRGQAGCCLYCCTPVGEFGQVDHLIPLATGGTNDPSNLGISCRSCNLRKWMLSPGKWVERMREFGYPDEAIERFMQRVRALVVPGADII